MSDFCVRRCKNCCFLASAEKFFPQKKTGSSAHPRFQSILPSIYLNICWSSDVVCPTSPHTSFPRTCPFQVSNYNIDISEIFTNPPATSPVSASLSLFPVPPARSPSASLSPLSAPHTSPCPCFSPPLGHTTLSISIYYSLNHLYTPRTLTVPLTFIRYSPHPARLSFRPPLRSA